MAKRNTQGPEPNEQSPDGSSRDPGGETPARWSASAGEADGGAGSTPLPFTHPMAVADLEETGGVTVAIEPDAAALAALAHYLDIEAITALAFRATLAPADGGWRLDATLAAEVVQACVVTLDPVASRIDTTAERLFLPGIAPPEGNEIELDAEADRAPEPLGREIDLAIPLIEALALALDPFPRAPGAAFGSTVYAPPGAAPMTDEAARPFAGLAALRTKLGDTTGDAD